MAFQQPRYRETVTGVGAGSSEARDVSSILQSVESDLKRYQQSVTIIGTSEDDDKTREEIIDIRTVIKNKLSTASSDIAQQQKSAGPRDRVALDKLSKQLQQQLSRYKQTVSDHDKRRAAYPLDTGGYNHDYRSGGGQAYHPSQQTVSLQVQQQGTEEREREAEELRALERDIVGLNEVFRDVAEMVHEQQEVINTIEKEVEQGHSRVQQGNRKLSEAVELVKSKRKLQICLLVTCIIIVIVILLVIIIPVAVTQSDD